MMVMMVGEWYVENKLKYDVWVLNMMVVKKFVDAI